MRKIIDFRITSFEQFSLFPFVNWMLHEKLILFGDFKSMPDITGWLYNAGISYCVEGEKGGQL